MNGRSDNETLQNLLKVRETYINDHKTSNKELLYILDQNQYSNANLTHLVSQDTLPENFKQMLAKLHAISNETKQAEDQLILLKDAKKQYQVSVNENLPNEIQEEQYQNMANHIELVKEKWNSVNTKLPFPKFVTLKQQLQAFSRELERNKPTDNIQDDFSDFHGNEEQINIRLSKLTDANITFIATFKDKLRQLQIDCDIEFNSFNILRLKEAKKSAEELLAAQENVNNIIKQQAAANVNQAFAQLPQMDKQHEALRQEVITTSESVYQNSTTTILVSAKLNNVSMPNIPSQTKLSDSPPRSSVKSDINRYSPSSSGSRPFYQSMPQQQQNVVAQQEQANCGRSCSIS